MSQRRAKINPGDEVLYQRSRYCQVIEKLSHGRFTLKEIATGNVIENVFRRDFCKVIGFIRSGTRDFEQNESAAPLATVSVFASSSREAQRIVASCVDLDSKSGLTFFKW